MMEVLPRKRMLCWGSAAVLFFSHGALPRCAYAARFSTGFQELTYLNPPSAQHNGEKKQGKKSKHEIPLLQALKELNRKRGIYFLYTDKSIGETMVVDIPHPKADVETILSELLDGSGLHYTKVNDKTFVILNGEIKKEERDTRDTVLTTAPAISERIVPDSMYHVVVSDVAKGIVLNVDGAPLSGVTVMVKGSSRGTITDARGAFVIEANRDNVLQFSSVGYTTREFTIRSDNDPIQVSLQVAQKEMTEVVMTALGIKKQVRSLGYATTEVAGSAFTDSRETNFGNALSGRVAGVSVSGDATGPYGSSRVVIRGNASLTANNQPLYVVDGVPFDNTNQGGYAGQYGGQDFGDGLSNISPDDIESVQVLKGVAAAALYGYRGGNGAILITTKSGPKQKGIQVELNNNLTFNSVIDNRDYQYQYGQGLWGLKPTSSSAAFAAPYFSWGGKLDGTGAINFLGKEYKYSPYRNQFRDFYETGLTNQSSLALEGANAKGHFRVGVSSLYVTPVIPNSNMQQVGININSLYALTKRLQLNLKADLVTEQVKNRASFSDAPGNAIASTLYLANSFDIRWLRPQVNYAGMELLPGDDTYFNNPYFVAYRFENSTTRNRLNGGVTLKYNFFDWLSAQGQVSRDGYLFDATVVTPSGTGYRPGGDFSQYQLTYHETNADYLVDFHKQWKKEYSVSFEFGGNTQDNVTQDLGVGTVPTLVQGVDAQRPVGPFIVPYLYSANNIANKPVQKGYAHYRVNSLYSSMDLGYKGLLYLTLTARNDWFSTLSPHSNSYLYPSASGSFVFSDAWKMPSWITYGKARLSFAKASNGTSPYQNVLTYGTQGYTTQGQLIGYVTQSNIPNPNLRPVNIREDEAGLNMQFLAGRLGFDLAFYDKETQDDILPVTVSPTSGYSGDNLNIGRVRNRGMEWLINAKIIANRHFAWDMSWNMGDNISKVLYLGPGVQNVVIAGALPRWGSEVNISNVVGLPYGQIMGFAYKKDMWGHVIFAPNGEPEQTGVVPLGSGMYKVTGGWSNELHWKRFTLDFLLDYKFGAKLYSQTNLLLYYYGLQKTTLQGREAGYIGKGVNDKGEPNTVAVPSQAYFQDISAGGSDHIAQEFVYDASFIKIRSLSLQYSFPTRLWKNGVVKELSVAFVGRNLATLLKHTPNIDPESNLNATNGQGLELSGYPAVRSLGFNLNAKF